MTSTVPQDPAKQAPMPCVIYAAKSTEDSHGSLPTQVAQCRRAIEREGGRTVISDACRDEGVSGYRSSRGPGLERAKELAIKAAADGGCAELWVQHSDRLARGDGIAADHLGEVFFAMRKAGVRLRSVQDDENVSDPVRAAVGGERNHGDSARKRQATRDGKRRRFDAGRALGGPVHDGYRLVPETTNDRQLRVERDGRVIYRRALDPQRAPLIERIFALVEQGYSFGDVARQLNGEGHRTHRGNHWSTRRVRQTIYNGYYAGWLIGYGERRRGTHPELIDPVRYEKLLTGLRRLDPVAAQRRKGGRQPTQFYLLRGVAFCGRCGGPMYTRNYAPGRHYVCRNVREATGCCDAPRVPAAPLEEAVLCHLGDFLPCLDEWISEKLAARHGERQALEHALAAERQRMVELERDVSLFRRDYARHLRAGNRRLADLALREVDSVDEVRAEQSRAIEAARARLEEWNLEPVGLDKAVDFYTEVRDTIRENVHRTSDAAALRSRLVGVLTGVWVQATDSGLIGAQVRLQEPAELAPDVFVEGIGLGASTRPHDRRPRWLAESGPKPWCRTIR